ncbi:UNVERIFIED_CONTAM: Retrovirus-related Pol polyprotein from transposon [Sesamum indicum]
MHKNPAPKPPFRPQTRNAPPKNLDYPKRFLTEAEVKAKREKNLCYRCDEPYVPGHRCKYKQVYMFLNDKEYKGDDKEDQTKTPAVKEGHEEEDVSVSLHAMRGSTCFKTLKEMQGYTFTHPIRLLKLGGYDLVLGCDWLSTYNPIELNFHRLRVSISLPQQKLVIETLPQEPLTRTLTTYSPTQQLRKVAPVARDGVTRSSKGIKYEEEALENTENIAARSIEHGIELIPEAIPKKQHPYRYVYRQKTEIERIVKEMLSNGIIRPSQSSFASLVLLKYLNQLTVKHNFPIPVINELLDEFHGSKYFTKIDLISSYFQIRMKREHILKTSFITHSGHNEFMVMPFGLCNAPSTFQALMNNIFESYLRKFVLVFFNDILIYSKTWEEHLGHIKEVMESLKKHQLYAKKSKCSFAQLKALKGFLGLTGYYRKFIKNYEIISKPLTALLKNDAFKWIEEAEMAFNQLKKVMTTAPVLAMPDFSQPFTVETDACGNGIRVVLMQPIAYHSKALAPRNLGLSRGVTLLSKLIKETSSIY